MSNRHHTGGDSDFVMPQSDRRVHPFHTEQHKPRNHQTRKQQRQSCRPLTLSADSAPDNPTIPSLMRRHMKHDRNQKRETRQDVQESPHMPPPSVVMSMPCRMQSQSGEERQGKSRNQHPIDHKNPFHRFIQKTSRSPLYFMKQKYAETPPPPRRTRNATASQSPPPTPRSTDTSVFRSSNAPSTTVSPDFPYLFR